MFLKLCHCEERSNPCGHSRYVWVPDLSQGLLRRADRSTPRNDNKGFDAHILDGISKMENAVKSKIDTNDSGDKIRNQKIPVFTCFWSEHVNHKS